MSRSSFAYRIVQVGVAVSILALVQLACALGAPQPTATPTATQTPLPTATSTPVPTRTPTLTFTPTLTATPTPNRTATSEAKAAATQRAAMAVVSPFLEKYGIKEGEGELAFFSSEPVQLEVDSYNTYYPNFMGDGIYKDFIFQTEVEWQSTGGLAGCGVLFRSDQDVENGSFYRLDIMRLQNAPAWRALYAEKGRGQSLGYGFDNTISDAQGGKNTLTVIARGANFKMFVNGMKMSEVDYNKLFEGLVGVLTWQESGKTSCTFSNSWIWALK